MEKAHIIEILEDWNFWTKDHDTGLNRELYLQKLDRLAGSGQVIAVLGVRRSGKSTILQQYIKRLVNKKISPKNILYINFEDVRFKEFNIDLLNRIYDVYLEYLQPVGKQYVFLDEIQKIQGWERFARTLHELKKAQVFVSGSNSKLLWGELSSLLTGRHLDLTVYPLNFDEFLKFRNIEIKNTLELIAKRYVIKSLLNDYLEYGGFPLVCLKEPKEELLQTFFEDIINKDVVENKKITNISKIKSLAKFYLTNVSKRISFRAISKFQELSLDTIERYSYYIEQAYLIDFVKKFSYSLKEQERTMSTVYCIDNGLRNLVSFKFSEDTGWLYQNTVANSLIQKIGKPAIFYWMSSTKEEVDFVVKPLLKVLQLIQVCYNVGDFGTKKREITSLLKGSKELKCNNLLVITEDYEKEEKVNGKKIKYVPLWKWLLR